MGSSVSVSQLPAVRVQSACGQTPYRDERERALATVASTNHPAARSFVRRCLVLRHAVDELAHLRGLVVGEGEDLDGSARVTDEPHQDPVAASDECGVVTPSDADTRAIQLVFA